MNILVINGPNLNMLGVRDKSVYGETSYKDLVKSIKEYAKENNVKAKCVQSNYEGRIIDYIHKSVGKFDAIIINAALNLVSIPKVEVHISNIYEREEFRKVNVIKDECDYSIIGQGIKGYFLAIDYLRK